MDRTLSNKRLPPAASPAQRFIVAAARISGGDWEVPIAWLARMRPPPITFTDSVSDPLQMLLELQVIYSIPLGGAGLELVEESHRFGYRENHADVRTAA